MEILHPICAGIDVHQASVTVCLRCCQDKGNVHLESRKFDTTTKGLLTLAEWLKESHCPIAGMESTGVYWKPVYHILSTQMEIVVGNARDIRARPGKKTDKSDAKWIAELLAHGMIPPSFVPSPEISALRDLTRARVQRIQTRTAAKNRIHKLLEDTNIKLSSVVSDLLGKSGRSMLEALISGERNAQSLARLAKGRLKPKIAQLELALEGRFTDHHAKLIQLELEQIDLCNKQIEAIEQEIDVLLLPMQKEAEHLQSIPGISKKSAEVILSEAGPDMSCFETPGRLASWVKICPGNNESAGKHHSGKSGQGNKYLKRTLVQSAWAVRKTETFLGKTFRRLEKRLGGKKAAVAVAHKILVIAFWLLKDGVDYNEERYCDRSNKEEEKRLKRAISFLEQAGCKVELPVPA